MFICTRTPKPSASEQPGFGVKLEFDLAWISYTCAAAFGFGMVALSEVLQLLSLQLSFQLHLHLLHLLALLCQAVLGMVLRWEMVKSRRILEMEV